MILHPDRIGTRVIECGEAFVQVPMRDLRRESGLASMVACPPQQVVALVALFAAHSYLLTLDVTACW